MKTINEYLLSKKNNKTKEEYYVLWPQSNIYVKLLELYGDKRIESGLDYWILNTSEVIDALIDFDKKYIHQCLKIYSIPNFVDVNDVKSGLEKRRIYPPSDLDKIDIDELI